MLSHLCPIVCWDEAQSWNSGPLCTERGVSASACLSLDAHSRWYSIAACTGALGISGRGPNGLSEMQLLSLQSGDKEAVQG